MINFGTLLSAELVSAMAAVGTFIVVAATAIAAIVQLRHLRSSNQINSIIGVQQIFESPEFRASARMRSKT